MDRLLFPVNLQHLIHRAAQRIDDLAQAEEAGVLCLTAEKPLDRSNRDTALLSDLRKAFSLLLF